MPDKVKIVAYQIAITVELTIEKSIEFLIQLHGDKGTTSEMAFINVKGKKIEQSDSKYTVMFEKAFPDYFVGELHTMVLYSRNFQYIYVHNVVIKLPQKSYKYKF